MFLSLKFIIYSILAAPTVVPFSFGTDPIQSEQPASVQCIVLSGDLPLTITWELNGATLSSSDVISIAKSGHRISTLAIESVSARLAGNYTCVARNQAGFASQTSELRVNGLCLLTYFQCMFCRHLDVLYAIIIESSPPYPLKNRHCKPYIFLFNNTVISST